MFKTIAVGTDGSETADKAVDVAFDLAERYQARLLIFSVYTPVSDKELARERAQAPDDAQWSIHATERVDATLARTKKRAQSRGLEAETVARRGAPAEVMCDLAAEYGADLLVIGNKGMNRRVLGSVPRSICQRAPCSVVLAKTT
ncbi:MAG TPA: universal stress protein [Solirubrobacteraceae bacterium]|jgi:nucleotide-binding universal stress UspA family protein|nr:universal stress protein [Solirubrobacteraceae bacterium]